MAFNDLEQLLPASITPIRDVVFTRTSNGTLRSRSRQTFNKKQFAITLSTDADESQFLLEHYEANFNTPFDFIYQGDVIPVTRSVMYVEPPVFSANEYRGSDVSLVLEEV